MKYSRLSTWKWYTILSEVKRHISKYYKASYSYILISTIKGNSPPVYYSLPLRSSCILQPSLNSSYALQLTFGVFLYTTLNLCGFPICSTVDIFQNTTIDHWGLPVYYIILPVYYSRSLEFSCTLQLTFEVFLCTKVELRSVPVYCSQLLRTSYILQSTS